MLWKQFIDASNRIIDMIYLVLTALKSLIVAIHIRYLRFVLYVVVMILQQVCPIRSHVGRDGL